MQHMKQGINSRLTPAALAVMLALGSGAAFAQQGDSGEGQQAALDTVVVSANKRIEKLDHVPMAISVLSDAVLQRNNVRDIEDVIALTPALTVTYGTTPANNGINMRGIGTTSIGIGVEADVAVIIDDIPMGMQVKAFSDLADLARVEVLKGPQSTLFGKAAIAGAVNIVTKPISGPMGGKTSMLYTDDGEWRLGLSYGGRVSDEFGFRVSASNNRFEGNVNNLTTGNKVNGSADRTFMAKLNWRPIPNLDIDFSPRYNKSSRNCCALVLTSFTPVEGALLSNIAQLPATQLLSGITPGPGNRDIRNDFPTGQNSTDRGAGLRLSWAFENGSTLTSITSIDHYLANDFRDQDFVDVPTLLYYPLANGKPAGVNQGYTQSGDFDVASRTQELRLTSPDDSTVKYVAGLWYGKNTIARNFIRGYNGIANTTPTRYYTDTYNKNYAVFGQATWEFAPTWSVLGGLRYNREVSGYHFSSGSPPPAEFKPTNVFSSIDNGENKVTGKLSLQKQFTPDLMGYVMGATGYKGMAYDLTSSLNAATAAEQPVKSETAKTLELGAKGNFFRNRLTVNLAAFYSKFSDYQQNAGSYLPGTTTYVTRLNSVGGVQTKGVELDLSALVTPDFVLNANLAFTRATITEFPNGPCYNVAGSPNGGFNLNCRQKDPNYGGQNVQDLAGGTMPNAPKWKISVDGQYDVRLPNQSFDGFVRANVRYQSQVLTNLNQDPGLANGAQAITNLGFGVRDKRDRYKLSFFVNNLFDRHYANTGFSGAGSWNSRAPNPVVNVSNSTWTPARDAWRYFGVRLDTRF
jgi:iron complex outermembrane receptor protein